MRLHRLVVEGFGPFRARQEVDFDAFADDGIFLIGGRTGAGKSSILDAVCFGLYGGVPRYDGGEKRLRSDHCEPDEPTSVTVEFSTLAGRFRVTRSPAYDRPAKRGGGLTTQAPSASLEERTASGWVGRAARVVDVAHELDEILQLSQEQFLQVILLAQNRFADFLLADSRERQALLRRLFGTERFADIQARFDERRRAAEHVRGNSTAVISARLDEAERLVGDEGLWGDDAASDSGSSTDERLERLQRALARAGYRVEQAQAARAAAERAHDSAESELAVVREQRQAQIERDRSRAALATLEAETPAVERAASRRDRGRAAEALRTSIVAVDDAAAATVAAERAMHDAVDAAVGAGAVPSAPELPGDGAAPRRPRDAEHFRALASDLTRESGGWMRALELEDRATAREGDIASARDAVERASEAVAALSRERDDLPRRIAEATEERDAARRAGDRAEELARAVAEAEQRCAGAADAERLSAAIESAARVESSASDAHAEAQAALARLRKRRLDGYAGELAVALVPGQPCAVCGSADHPAPAAHTDPVSPEDIERAESARDAAARAEREAGVQLAGLRAERAAATERSGGRTIEQARNEHETARAAYARASAAAAEARELQARIDRLRDDASDVETRFAAAVEDHGDARTRLSLAEQRDAEARRIVADARGRHRSVAERLDEARTTISAASGAAAAIDRFRAAAAAEENARDRRERAVAASVFRDVADAQAALLPTSEIEALDAQVTQHAVRRAKERALLLDLELRALPDEPIAVEPAEAAAKRAREVWAEAVDADSRARQVLTGLTAAVSAAQTARSASAAHEEEYEVIRRLADTIGGRSENTHRMTLETFVLAAELEEIVEVANVRLHDMSDGRYALRHSDALASRGAASGLGIVVFDAFTGRSRPARSLSGGETFLASLALALGLAEAVTARAGGIRLDTLFIDEGFGSLDGDTLETAMRTLDELRQGGRTVGVISHVEAMQEQIPAQVTVRALLDGPSVIDAPTSRGD